MYFLTSFAKSLSSFYPVCHYGLNLQEIYFNLLLFLNGQCFFLIVCVFIKKCETSSNWEATVF